MSQVSWIGKTLGGRYTINERLGQGGMSAVYKAMDPNLRRIVAIKMIHPHLSDNVEFIRRFEEEAAGVAQLRHPNIIQVFDFNHDEETYYMVLEFVPGETLQERLRRLNEKNRRMPLVDAITFITQVSDAVQYAHERGMIHRDIKPANIMLDVYGKAILMDFGIAKMMGGQLHTATGAVVGTAMYMSPEQITGEKVDERSDIYSLGVTLFECISGRPPYEADSAMTLMMMHLNDPIPNLREIQPEIPADLAALVEKALQKKRDGRFSSAAQFASALRQLFARLQDGVEAQNAVSLPSAPDATVIEGPQENGATVVEPEFPAGNTPPGFLQEVSLPIDRAATPPPPPAGSRKSQQVSGSDQAVMREGSVGQTAGYQKSSASNYLQAGGGGTRSTPPPGFNQQPVRGKPDRSISLPLIIGGGIGILGIGAVILILLLVLGRNLLAGGTAATATTTVTQAVVIATSTTENVVVALAPTDTSMPTATATTAPTETPAPPTDTPAPVYTPTPTVPADRPYVRINAITIQDGRYVVEYETFQYTEQLPGMHVHFFFDTVAPDQAGVPGNGPWILYGGPRPFSKYSVAAKPNYATMMCALVANANHSIHLESGNCLLLPDQ